MDNSPAVRDETIILRERAALSSRVKTSITATDIAKAYVFGDATTQERIETYGKSNAEFLRSLIRS
jgi:predicted RNA polymerase sigma factor